MIEQAAHINWLELKAVLLALQHFKNQVSGKVVGIMSDNSSVVAYLNKQGGTVSQDLCLLTMDIFSLTENLQVTLKARYIPGKKNVWADHLSRKNQIISTEWSLHQEVADFVLDK